MTQSSCSLQIHPRSAASPNAPSGKKDSTHAVGEAVDGTVSQGSSLPEGVTLAMLADGGAVGGIDDCAAMAFAAACSKASDARLACSTAEAALRSACAGSNFGLG